VHHVKTEGRTWCVLALPISSTADKSVSYEFQCCVQMYKEQNIYKYINLFEEE